MLLGAQAQATRMQDETDRKTRTAQAKRIVGSALATGGDGVDEESVADTLHDALNLASSTLLV